MFFIKIGGFLFMVKLYIIIVFFFVLINLYLIYFDIGESLLLVNNRIIFGVIVLVCDGYDYGNFGNVYFNLDIIYIDDWFIGIEVV